jgi:cell division protein ZapA (FtsZ GTPase activity inhibitor)
MIKDYRAELSSLKEKIAKIQGLIATYQAKKAVLEDKKSELVASLLALTKLPSLDDLDAFRAKLEKEVETKMAMLSEQVAGIEKELAQIKMKEMSLES